MIKFSEIIHRLAFVFDDVSETGLCPRPHRKKENYFVGSNGSTTNPYLCQRESSLKWGKNQVPVGSTVFPYTLTRIKSLDCFGITLLGEEAASFRFLSPCFPCKQRDFKSMAHLSEQTSRYQGNKNEK
jgi:hypothetical protein